MRSCDALYWSFQNKVRGFVFACDVTAAMLVVMQEQMHFSPLGTEIYFHVNSSRKNSVVLIPNMAAL